METLCKPAINMLILLYFYVDFCGRSNVRVLGFSLVQPSMK